MCYLGCNEFNSKLLCTKKTRLFFQEIIPITMFNMQILLKSIMNELMVVLLWANHKHPKEN